MTHLVRAAAIALLFATRAGAQGPSFRELRARPDADTAKITWLEQNVAPAEMRELFALLRAGGAPENVQLVAQFYSLDGTATTYRAAVDSLSRRPPAGEAGYVHAAHALARVRKELLDRVRARGLYPLVFRREALRLPAPGPPRASSGTFRLRFDFAPAETLLALVTTPDLDANEAYRRLEGTAFEALFRHRSQSFYPAPITRDRLARNVAAAASTAPAERLYMYAHPLGLLHMADVRAHAADYRRVLDTLRARERDILRLVADTIAPYLPPGTVVERQVSFFFADGADGWASGTVAAVDLEYVKDDYARLLTTLIHETFHAAQSCVPRRVARALMGWTPGDSLIARAFGILLAEGTANFIAPARIRTDSAAGAAAADGARILRDLLAVTGRPFDRARGSALVDEGVASGGPFYWLGAAMSRAIVRDGGPQALAATLRSDGVDFVLAYLRATERARTRSLLPPEIAAAARRLGR